MADDRLATVVLLSGLWLAALMPQKTWSSCSFSAQCNPAAHVPHCPSVAFICLPPSPPPQGRLIHILPAKKPPSTPNANGTVEEAGGQAGGAGTSSFKVTREAQRKADAGGCLGGHRGAAAVYQG